MIPGRIVERLLAAVIATGFELSPGTIHHCCKHNAYQARNHSIYSGNIRFEDWQTAGMKANREWGVAGKVIEHLLLRNWYPNIIISTQEAAQRFAQ
jgi:hypothetical protein